MVRRPSPRRRRGSSFPRGPADGGRLRVHAVTRPSTPSSAASSAATSRARARMPSSRINVRNASAKLSDVSSANGIGAGPTPLRRQTSPQSGWSPKNGTTNVGRPAPSVAWTVPAPPWCTCGRPKSARRRPSSMFLEVPTRRYLRPGRGDSSLRNVRVAARVGDLYVPAAASRRFVSTERPRRGPRWRSQRPVANDRRDAARSPNRGAALRKETRMRHGPDRQD